MTGVEVTTVALAPLTHTNIENKMSVCEKNIYVSEINVSENDGVEKSSRSSVSLILNVNS